MKLGARAQEQVGQMEGSTQAILPSRGIASRVHCVLLIAGLCGPAIGAYGIYGVNVLVFLVVLWVLAQWRNFRLPREQVSMILIGAALLGYVLLWGALSGGEAWAYKHFAIVFLSGTAFVVTSVLACHAGASAEVLRWLTRFTWTLLCLCVFEAMTGVRLPVSRYSTMAPLLGFVYEGHDGHSELFENLWIPTGFFGNQNNLAFALLCLMPFALAGTRRGGPRLLLSVLAVAVLVVSESRTALAVAVAWALGNLILRMIRHRPVWAPLSLLFAVGAIGVDRDLLFEAVCGDSTQKVCWALLVAQKASLDDLAASPDSIGVRFQLASQAWTLWTESPMFGVGPGHLGGLISAVHMDGVVLTDAHNAPLQILAEYGIVGAAAWVAAGVVVLRALLRMPDDENAVGRFRHAALVLFTLIPFASVTVSTMYYFVPIWVLVGALFGVALGERPRAGAPVALPKSPRPIPLTLDPASRIGPRPGVMS